MTSILVTGSAGQVGRALKTLIPEASFLDRAGLDISNRDSVMERVREIRPKVLINAAAFTRVDEAESEADLATAINGSALEHLAEAADEAGALLVQLSTDYVFEGAKDGAYSEHDDPNPLSSYGRSKLLGERNAARAKNHLIIRTSWVFGDGSNFIRSILKAAQSRKELAVVDDQRGLPTYALDLAGGLLRLVEGGARGLYHLAGGGSPASWADLAELAIEVAGLETNVRRATTHEYYADRSGTIAPRPFNSVLDCSKAQRLGVSLRPWQEAVSEYVKKEIA